MTTNPHFVADIGGANARFALASRAAGKILVERARTYSAGKFATLCDAAGAYLEETGARPTRACFAVAGPLVDGQVKCTNSPWILKKADVVAAFGLSDLIVMNDFHALAAGIAHAGPDALAVVKEGAPLDNAPQLVIGPGAGLGQAIIAPGAGETQIIATEGGHVAFAPCTDEELEVRNFIARDYGRVSAERLLSGDGLADIYRALCGLAGAPREYNDASDVTAAALDQADAIAVRSVGMFCQVLGRVAGDAVLSTGARGGVYLGGGILPRIREFLMQSDFVESFLDKGRMRSYLAPVPVTMIIEEGVALLGAATAMEARVE